MLRHATGFYLGDEGHDTRAIQLYLGPQEHPAYRAVHGAKPGKIKRFLERLISGAFLVSGQDSRLLAEGIHADHQEVARARRGKKIPGLESFAAEERLIPSRALIKA
jgi:hypothetical protein